MRRLAGAHELLDGPLDDAAVLRGNLRDLARINRSFGGASASRRAVEGLVGRRTVPHTLLDVGTGAADIPLTLMAAFDRRGRSLAVTAVDSRAEVLDAARALTPRIAATPGLNLAICDALELPWPDRSFDIVHASLVLHHLEPREAVALLREAGRVSRLGVVVNDLVRARRHWLAARVVLPVMTRNRYTRYDGPLSVQRAYTRVEYRALLAGAALRPIGEFRALGGHRVAIAAVPIRGSRMTGRLVDVAVVGGGPSGAATAIRLARLGHEVVVLERATEWRWRAGGVFASPAAMRELRRLGLDGAAVARVARSIPGMRVETPRGTAFRLTYGAETGSETAVGFDRSALDPLLLDVAAAAGAEVRRGAAVGRVVLPGERGPATLELAGDDAEPVTARVVVGADGPRSVVARAAGVVRPPVLGGRVGLTWHVADEPDDAPGDEPREARMVVLGGGAYCGIAPVPGRRVNVGIVLAGRAWRERLARNGAAATGAAVLRLVPPLPGDGEAWRKGRATDAIAGASPLGCRVARRAGPGWYVVGDAAGFLDPFTGEGLHRAFVSARLAAGAIDAELRGRSPGGPAAYERAMQGRFASKDVVSRLVLAFLDRPALFDRAARRLAARDDIRATMGLVMGDLVPASRALDPRFLAGLLRP